jgi:hypothetical protein
VISGAFRSIATTTSLASHGDRRWRTLHMTFARGHVRDIHGVEDLDGVGGVEFGQQYALTLPNSSAKANKRTRR